MSLTRSNPLRRLAPRALAAALATGSSAALLFAIPVSAAHAQSAPACAATWSASAVYTQGNVASKGGNNYKANWWTQGNDPATSSGGAGSGQPWTSQGACGSAPPTDPPPTNPPPTNPPATSGLFFSPYKDITINLDWNTNRMRSAVTGSPLPLVGSGSVVSTAIPNLGGVTLSFATGACGSETWGGISGPAFASANIAALDNAGLYYMISTGGAAGTFTCDNTAAMDQFLSRYVTPHMVGIDFDIEGGQSQQTISNLVAAAKYAHSRYPNLRFSFTVATLAASDGSYGGVNAQGDAVVRAVKAASLPNATINLMAFDFGNPSAAVCVVSNGKCDLGRSAIQAVTNLRHTYGLQPGEIEVTTMIGQNDSQALVTYPADVDTIVNYAVANGLAGVHHWSFDRDTPCADGSTGYASPVCNSLSGTASLEYSKRFLHALGR